MHIYGHGWGMMAGIFVFWVLVLGAGLWLLARLFPAARTPQTQEHLTYAGADEPAVQVARQRYASGEISKSEYEEVVETLARTTPIVQTGLRQGL